MVKLNTWLYFALACLFAEIKGARILMVPVAYRSHMKYLNTVGNVLAQNGHQVFSAVPHNFPNLANLEVGNISWIFYESAGVSFDDKVIGDIFRRFFANTYQGDFQTGSLQIMSMCKDMMADTDFIDKVQMLDLDLAIVDAFVLTPCNLILPRHLGMPYISLTSMILPTELRIPEPSSFAPALTGAISDRMTFRERLINTAHFYMIAMLPTILGGWLDTSLIKAYANISIDSDWGQMLRQSELVFNTRDHLLEWPVPSMPHVVSIACITCKPPQELPRELADFVDGAKYGVILVSFGTIASHFPESIIKKLSDVFRRVKYHVVWKFPGGTASPNTTKNVKMLNWIPQNSLLGHEKTKLFITHCGNNGQYEAIYHGVPMISFPTMAEQPHNAMRAENKNIAVTLNIRDFTADELLSAINTVLGHDSVYVKTVKRLSRILKTASKTPQQNALYWVEHILKHGGKHLRTHALDMPLYQFYLPDVFAFITFTILVTVVSSFCLLRCFKRFCFQLKPNTTSEQ